MLINIHVLRYMTYQDTLCIFNAPYQDIKFFVIP